MSLFLQSNFELNELGELPLYYFDCVKYWRQMKCEFVISKEDFNNQFLWYNTNIKVNSKTVYNFNMFNSGLWNVNDLYDKGKLIPFNVWLNLVVHSSNYMLWHGIINALPVFWKTLLKLNTEVSKHLKPCSVQLKKDSYLSLKKLESKHQNC